MLTRQNRSASRAPELCLSMTWGPSAWSFGNAYPSDITSSADPGSAKIIQRHPRFAYVAQPCVPQFVL